MDIFKNNLAQSLPKPQFENIWMKYHSFRSLYKKIWHRNYVQ